MIPAKRPTSYSASPATTALRPSSNATEPIAERRCADTGSAAAAIRAASASGSVRSLAASSGNANPSSAKDAPVSNAVSAKVHGWSHWITRVALGEVSPCFAARKAWSAAPKALPASACVSVPFGDVQKNAGGVEPAGSASPRRAPVGAPSTQIFPISLLTSP